MLVRRAYRTEEREMKIRTILQAGNVARFHNSIGMDKQKNSEHQWETALVLQHIYPECSKELLLAALTHDSAEYYTGDVPFPIKQASPELKVTLDKLEEEWEKQHGVYFELNDEEKYFLKMADTFSGLWYCILQVREGKINARRAFRKWRGFADTHLNSGSSYNINRAYDFFNKLCLEMEKLS